MHLSTSIVKNKNKKLNSAREARVCDVYPANTMLHVTYMLVVISHSTM